MQSATHSIEKSRSLADVRRMNVALTRVRRKLWLIGESAPVPFLVGAWVTLGRKTVADWRRDSRMARGPRPGWVPLTI